MALENERLQEIFLVVGDKLAPVNKKWWFALGLTIILVIPIFYVVKLVFVRSFSAAYQPPKIIYTSVIKEPLQILDTKIFEQPSNTYYGYAKIRNTNLSWGVANQDFTVQFKTPGGTVVHTYQGSTYVLPGSDKFIIIPRFPADKKPEEIIFNLEKTNFISKPVVDVNLKLERNEKKNTPDGLVLSSGIGNLTPFTINRIDLPVVFYNEKNEIIGVSFTYINKVESGEIRTFQYLPIQLSGSVRPEITPEVNIFDRNLFSTQSGISPF